MTGARSMDRLSPVSAARANGVAWLTSYAASVRSWIAILVTLAACHDRDVERLTAIKETVCSCRTATCAEQAVDQVSQATIASNHRTQALARDMMDCVAKLHAAERPIIDPDAEGSASEPPAPPAAKPASTPPAAAAKPAAAKPGPPSATAKPGAR